MIINSNLSSFDVNKILSIVKRDNNKKRPFLLLNSYQAKHVPTEPKKATYLFHETKVTTNNVYANEKLLIIGFAETATAIGAFIANELNENSSYLQTTREDIDDQYKVADFSEEHSHATEQKLYCKDWNKIIKDVDRIIFIEDELTTGKTILNFIDALSKTHDNKLNVKYSVISIVNAMSKENLEKYIRRNISVHYLIKIDSTNIEKDIARFEGQKSEDIKYDDNELKRPPKILEVDGFMDTRLGVKISEYKKSCDILSQKVYDLIEEDLAKSDNVLVLGTEELTYPSLIFAKKLQDQGYNVKVHATTRSPIMAIKDERYTVKSRAKLRSLYCDSRVTYIYNLDKYDCVVVITDSDILKGNGYKDLCKALSVCGNDNITLIRWRK